MVEAFGGEARLTQVDSRNARARLVGMEEAHSSGSEPYSVAAMAELGVRALAQSKEGSEWQRERVRLGRSAGVHF